MTDDQLIDAIQAARGRNNVNWMNLLRLAIRLAPTEARAIFDKIQQCDSEVAALTARLGKG